MADIGCGTGQLLETLRRLLPEAELIGIDPAEGMISVARARFHNDPRVRLEVSSADHLPLGDGSLDVVTTTLSFHHWEHQGAALREVARVLRPGGRLLLADILGFGVIGRWIRPHGNRHGSGYRTEARARRDAPRRGVRGLAAAAHPGPGGARVPGRSGARYAALS